MEMLWDDGNRYEFNFVHLHNGTETDVTINMPAELYEEYEAILDDIHRCLEFG